MLLGVVFTAAFVCWLIKKQSPEEEAEEDKKNEKKRRAPRALKQDKKKPKVSFKKESSDSDSNEDDDSESDCDSNEHSSDEEEEYKSYKKQKTSTSKTKKIPDVWIELWTNLNSKTNMCDVPGDGDCLFSAIELSNLTLENKTAKKQKLFDANSLKRAAARLRRRTIKYMKENPDEIKPFMQDDETLEDHLKKMEKKTCWAEEVHVQVLTKLFEKPVFVYRQSNGVIAVAHKYGEEWHKIDQSGDNVIRIFYEPEHYQAIALV
jgi:hypothetical protein